jgi:hypothetical protein
LARLSFDIDCRIALYFSADLNCEDEAMPSKRKLEVVDASGLTDVDWAAIKQVQRAFEIGGANALGRTGKFLR